MNVYVSNPGLLCGAGKNPDEFFDSMASGNTGGIKKVRCGEKVFFAGKIDDAELKPTGDKHEMRVLKILDSALNQIAATVQKAVALYGAKRVGVCLGSCDNGSECSFEGHKTFFEEGRFAPEYDLKIQGADYPATFTKKKFDLEGICLAFSTACSSSASAIIKAKELIECGLCDAVVAGGVDVASNTVLLGFDSLGAVSNNITNPMSANRSGITLGEGAAFFVLSKDDLDETAIVLKGTGESSDAHHTTAPVEDGSGAAQAMEAALKDANLSPSQIDYVNLHATGTKLNDSMEAKAVQKVFGTQKVYASGTKPLTGHTLGAAGAIELAACFLSLRRQTLPIHVWDGVQDTELPELNLIGEKNFIPDAKIKNCMSNSFAFGGCNASLIIGTEEK